MTSKILSAPDLAVDLEQELAAHSTFKRPLVFTNGCFDIIHRGHVDYLYRAAAQGETLIVGVNSDDSVRRQNKSPQRPINRLEDRLAVLSAMEMVDFVVAFDEDTPLALIEKVKPDVLVKGGDWPVEKIVGNDLVWSLGGKVMSIAFNFDRSTTAIIEKIKKTASGSD